MEKRFRKEMLSVIDALLSAHTFDNREVFLFGHCNATEELADYLLENGIAIAAILDNNRAKQGLDYREILIISPEHLARSFGGNSIVLIANRFYEQMKSQLQSIGYDGEIVKAVDYDSFSEYSLSEETLHNKRARVIRGVSTLERIRLEHPHEHLVVCPYNALGDVYWAMAFLPPYLKKRGLEDAVVIAVGAGHQVAEMFGKKKIIAIDQAEMDEFIQALIFTQEGNHIIAHHDRPYTDNIIIYLNKHFLSFIDYYCCAVYGHPKGTQPITPSVNLPLDNAVGLKRGASVIIAPYAKSVVAPPKDFWFALVEAYHRDGLSVFTNVAGDEKPLAGTKPISMPLGMMIPAVEYAGNFIGLRSGICDIVHSARCKKTVVFPNCIYSTTPYQLNEVVALPGWNQIII